MAISIQIIGQIKPDIQFADMFVLAKDSDIIKVVLVTDNLRPDNLLDSNLMHNKSYLFVSSLSLVVNRESRIILIGNNVVDYYFVKCLIAGIFGYLDRKYLDMFLIQAIRAVDSGEAWASRQIVTKLIGTVSG